MIQHNIDGARLEGWMYGAFADPAKKRRWFVEGKGFVVGGRQKAWPRLLKRVGAVALGRSGQKPRFLPAGYEVMSAESAAGDFQPIN
jgi:hypothetical protein